VSSGAFRDASAAIERAQMLEKENEDLRDEIAKLAGLRDAADEVERLRADVEQLRSIARGENEGAYLTRLGEERDELTKEVADLKAQVAQQERQIRGLRLELKKHESGFQPVATLIDGLTKLIGGKKR